MSKSQEIKDEYKTIFLEESEDQLREWEEGLLDLEKSPDKRDLIDKIFRAIHTLKGSAGFVGFDDLQKVTHDLESGLQAVRDGEKKLDKKSLDLLFEGLDICQKLIDDFDEGKTSNVDIDGFLQKVNFSSETNNLKNTRNGDVNDSKNLKDKGNVVNSQSGQKDFDKSGKLWAIDVKIEATQREAYLRSLLLQSRLGEIGKIISINPSIDDLMKIGDDFRFRVVLQTEKQSDDIKKAANIDLVNVIEVSKLQQDTQGGNKEEVKRDEEKVDDDLKDENKKNDGEAKRLESKKVSEKSLKHHDEVVRVPVEKLDVMLNLVGELVVQNSGFISITGKLKETYGRTGLMIDLEEKIENLAKIARDLQDAVMKVRMLPIGSVFSRFYRVVRDLSRVRNKSIELEVYGEDTEIDKKIIDRIGEPLVHLIRNAVDHGIESVEERKTLGKVIPARIRLGAYQEGDHICVEVTDDGRGMDRDAILEKAFEKGLVKASDAEKMSDEEVYGLVFYPGFSTAKEITDISGRGVGLDVVKSTIEEMGGDVRVKSEKGNGTTIILTLPLTMAIISAILVVAFDSLFAIPISSIKEIIKIRKENFKKIQENKVIRLRDEVIPVVYLDEVLGINENLEEANRINAEIPIVIVNFEGSKVGIGVDKLIGNEEIVIKSLSKHFREVEGLAGASILGDGRIALILDIQTLVKNYGRGENISLDSSFYHRANGQVSKVIENNEKENKEIDESVFDVFEEEDSVKITNTNEQIDKQNIKNKDNVRVRDVEISNVNSGGNDEIVDKKELINFDSKQKEIIEELNINGAVNASASMTQLMGKEVRVSFPSVDVVSIGDVAERLGGEESPVGAIYVGMTGDIEGGILTVLPMKSVFQFSDLLLRRKPGTTSEIKEEETSALCEMGNILAAAFINSIAEATGYSTVTDVPEMGLDMCQSVIDTILIRFNQPGDKIVLTEADIYFSDDEQTVCHLLLFLEESSIKKLSNGRKNSEKIKKTLNVQTI